MTEAPTAGTDAPASTKWWESPDYQGELILPGQSRLDPQGRKLLEEIAARAEKGLLDIPPMPKAAMDAMKLLRSADAEIPDVAVAIQIDPVLTALVLKHANSALYGPRHVIDTITQAVSYIGLRRMKDLVLSAAMRRVAGDVKSKAWAEAEWKYSVTCAAIARDLGKRLRVDDEQCYVAGLLHDIGRLPVLMALDAKGALPPAPAKDVPADIIIEALHRGIGLQVASKWEQPPSVADAIANHLTGRMKDEDDRSQFRSTLIAEASGDLCIALGLGRAKRPFGVLESPTMQALGMSKDEICDWLENGLPKVLQSVATIA